MIFYSLFLKESLDGQLQTYFLLDMTTFRLLQRDKGGQVFNMNI
ncbi:hypothetical protein SynA1560_01891 [Synechococcus sp. A15-60]|nr:hypothetical protein SynA1560_01891 [Synechococcus sp. A15-60]